MNELAGSEKHIMTLKETLLSEMTVALKAQKTDPAAGLRLSTLRAIAGEIVKAETEGTRHELTDTQVESILRREAKTRRETAENYRVFNVPERADREDQEAVIIEEFLPTMLTETEVSEIVEKIVQEQGLAGAGGRAIGQIMGTLKGRSDIDMGVASKVARKLLG